MSRTETQRKANEADADLYRLIVNARRNQWADVSAHLTRARHELRKRMHPADRQGTEGE